MHGSRKRKVSTPCHTAAPAGVPAPVVCEQAQEGVPAALINDHPSSESGDGIELQPASNATNDPEEHSSPKPDLMAYSGVTFEEEDSIPGVRYTTPSGDAAWTPVVCRHRPRRKPLQPLECKSDGSDQENAEQNFRAAIKSARGVTFQSSQGAPD